MAAAQENAPWLSRLRQHVQREGSSSQDVEQSHLFQQLTSLLRTVAQEHPLLLILDDLQWADTASIGLLFHLGRRLADREGRVLIACAYRPEEVTSGRTGERHPLAKPLNEFKRAFGDIWVDLGRAEAAEGRSFVDALLDSEPNRLADGFRVALFQRTEGHALFTVELLRAMQERGDLLKDNDGRWIEGPSLDWKVLPARVEAVIEERIDQLDPELREVLTVASVEGEVFTAQVVAETLATAERETMHLLSQELEWRHRLVREQDEVHTVRGRLSRYRFGHVLFQIYLYRRLSPGERRLLHGDVAAALEKLYDGQLDEMAVQLGRHFHQAGDYERACQYFTLAAERAARLFANDEAIGHYTRAIELTRHASQDVASVALLHRGRGLAYEALGEFEQARADHESILQIARAAAERPVEHVEWRALLDLGKLWRSRDYNRSRDYFERALDLARRTEAPAVLADSLNWMGNWYANDDKPLAALELHHEALEIFDELENRRELANTLDLLGIAYLLSGDFGTSVQYYDRAIALFRESDDRPRLASSLMGRANTYSMLALLALAPAALPRDAATDYCEALRIAREIDSAPAEAWGRYSLGLMHTVRGHFGRALEEMEGALRIASDIQHREFVVGSRFALGILYSELCAPTRARTELEGALALAEELNSPTWIYIIRGALAQAYYAVDDHSSAQACLETAVSPSQPLDTLGKRYCWVRRAELALAQGDPGRALDITERLIASAPGLSPGRVITYLWKLKAEALAATGCEEDALPLLHAAIENAQAIGERSLLWRVHASLARLHNTLGREEAAQKELAEARELIEDLAATIPDEALKNGFLHGARSALVLD
jgi:tetratricopeptide (TPR) repeat protein